jgi:rhodanese-related sulfurtransferase
MRRILDAIQPWQASGRGCRFGSVVLRAGAGSEPVGATLPDQRLSIPQSQIIQPDELNKLLQAHRVERPLILQVGSHVLFAQAHIPGSEYAGPGSQDAGLQQLRARVGPLPRKTFIVVYCGCCPWNRCPNVGPAYKALTEMGFTRVKVLYLADNFGADWADKGFPVETGR